MDQDVFIDEGYKTTFLARDACTSKMPAILAREANTAPLPVFIRRQGSQHIITIHPEVNLSKDADEERAVQQDTQSFTTIISDFIKVYPDQWFWLQDRWKPPRGRVFRPRFPSAELLRELRGQAKGNG